MEKVFRLLRVILCVLMTCIFDWRHKTAYRRCDRKVWECKEWMCREYERCDCSYRYRDVL